MVSASHVCQSSWKMSGQQLLLLDLTFLLPGQMPAFSASLPQPTAPACPSFGGDEATADGPRRLPLALGPSTASCISNLYLFMLNSCSPPLAQPLGNLV